MIRHASAPGTGESDEFRLDDSATQHHLDEAGRPQARAIGEWWRARVYTGQWRRCRETTDLLDPGTGTALPALDSFPSSGGRPNATSIARP